MRPRNVIEQRLSRVRLAEKEWRKLYIARRNLALIPLEKPIRHGWYRHYELRDDILRRKDAAVFQEILNACGSEEWGHTKLEIDERWERSTWCKDDWQWPGFRRIGKRAYRRLSVQAKKYFVEYEVRWNPWQGSIRRYHCHVPQYYFVPSYTKAYVTHLQSVDSELDSKIARLENELLGDELFAITRRGKSDWPNKWMRKRNARRTRHLVKTALNEYDDEDRYDLSIGKVLDY